MLVQHVQTVLGFHILGLYHLELGNGRRQEFHFLQSSGKRVNAGAGGRGGTAREGVGVSQGKGSLPKWGGMRGKGVREDRRDVRRERSVSGARPHLVQLVLEHFQLR